MRLGCASVLIFCLCAFWLPRYSSEEGCRIVARILPQGNSTTANTSRATKNFDNVDILYSNADDFMITGRLGSGSFGEAYLGHNITSNEQYVVKLYRFGKLKRKKMFREIFVTQSICGHPNIIKLYHVIKQSLTGYPALVFEYAKDTYYRDLYPKLTPEDVRYYMYEILQGLAYAHERGVMHKDLKPANIMIDHEKRKVKIIDWGLSQFYFQQESQSVAGSMYYKSPEMLMDYMQSELSTDIWSLGCVFAALLYRKSIFFVGENNMHQLITIADVLGTQGLLDYNAKYSMSLNVSTIVMQTPRTPWERLVTQESRAYATPEALHLLDHMLVYDHKMRISAKDALMHPYFRPLRRSEETLGPAKNPPAGGKATSSGNNGDRNAASKQGPNAGASLRGSGGISFQK